MSDEEREKALADLAELTSHAPVRIDLRRFLLGTGYDAGRASRDAEVAGLETERRRLETGWDAAGLKLKAAEARVEQVALAAADLAVKLGAAEAALATERERGAALQAVIEQVRRAAWDEHLFTVTRLERIRVIVPWEVPPPVTHKRALNGGCECQACEPEDIKP